MQTIYDAKILIVDDNQDLLNLVTTALRSTGYNQLTACTGCAAAQAAFAANRPDLMILDINLPDGDGFTLFRTLHSMADIPALFLSARDADADRLFGLGLGADDYLTKPFLTQELLLRIQRILQRCYRGELQRTAAKTLQLGQRTVYLADALVRLPDGTAQPLRRRSTQVGPYLRRVVATFCENPLAARCTLDCSITPAVETAILHADAALLTRALENVLQNAVRHNAGPITLTFHADADETTLHLTIQDDGTGYPQSVLAVLNGEPEGENAPHILGLHVVEQIVNAHGGSVQFVNRDPHGAKVMMQLPLAKDENEK